MFDWNDEEVRNHYSVYLFVFSGMLFFFFFVIRLLRGTSSLSVVLLARNSFEFGNFFGLMMIIPAELKCDVGWLSRCLLRLLASRS